MSSHNWSHIKGLRLADNDFLTPRPIDIIIGADHYGLIIKPNIIKGAPTMPIAQLSIFGWLIIGPVNSRSSLKSYAHLVTINQDDEERLQQLLTRFWIQEEVPLNSFNSLTQEEEECEAHFRETHSRDSTGRYIVRIPLKMPPSMLGSSYSTALSTLQHSLRRFKRDEDYHKLYSSFMREYEELGHMVRALDTHHGTTSSEIQPGDSSGEMTLAHEASASGGLRVSSVRSQRRSHTVPSPYYLPHHGVLKLDSATTKLRVVFNGSSSSSSGKSVNDLMHTGANLLLNIVDVLTWIRHHQYLFSTDISKMYRQVRVHEDDWDLQRILWMDDQSNVVPYQLTTVTYGTKAAPFLASRALLQLVEDEGQRFPLAIPSLTHGRYVDDIFGGADSITELIEIAQQLIDLCNAGGFPLAKWHATHQDLLKAVSPGESASSTISFDDCMTKILGLKWAPLEDKFFFTTTSPPQGGKISKRLILSEVAQIFDPLGFASPVIVRAKMLLQELWLHKLSWDDPLPPQVASRWLIIREDLSGLANLSIPRWFQTRNDSTVELHGFSDASQFAMAAVVYITVHSPSADPVTSLVISKTKVAPLKRMTIPRLELTAALLLAKLVHHVQATLKLNITATHLWTDSQVTLSWIKTHASRWKDYVGNRVAQIQELTSHAQWRHVPGNSNPADCASRGVTTTQLQTHSLWWTGPPWLTQPSHSWPTQPQLSADSTEMEARPGVALFATTQQLSYHWDLIYKYSSLIRLYRLTALCFRILAKLKGDLKTEPVVLISSADFNRARFFWIQATQAIYFQPELKILASSSHLPPSHPLNRLTPFIDSQGILRLGGRLTNSQLSYEEQHPAILPRESQLSSLIIAHAHDRTMHGGTQLTLSHIRQNYWIIGGRAPVKTHILRCVTCARQRGIRAHQLMGQLPPARVTPSRPFSHTGVDYAGPITLKTWKGRGSKTQKGWICVFVCMATSAVHLEVVSDYSTDGFLATYRRFSARRGLPHTLYSDCGTNFIGAEAALKRLFIQGSQENKAISSILSKDQTQWKFNPPAAPHMGGKWEAAVKSLKFHLRRTIGETLLTFEGFTTLLSQIEAVLNSRPLEPLSDDPDDFSVLTPGHFLVGTALTALPEPSLVHLPSSRLSHWQLIQQKLQHFWSHWSAHYLQRQQSISKWHHPSNIIKVGSMVLLTDERLPPSKWPLARVLQLHPGADGLTRVVTLKTATSTLTRPISKLAPLPLQH